MPMIDIQRRHQTIFRIRFGEQVADSRSKTGYRPAKLTDAIRVTSANPDVIDAFTDVYGGKRKPWEQQYEAKLPTSSLNILVLPGQSVSQWWEKYSGSVCERRCDGAFESKSGKPCICGPDVEARTADRNQCSPTTRVSVICPDVAVVGSGMFVCHGLVGAETLPQSIAVAEAALSRGLMVPAVLRVVEFKGLKHFIVPQIEVVGMSFNALAAAAQNGELQHATKELEAPANGDGNGASPRFTPVNNGAPLAAPPRSIADQFGEFEQQSDEKTRARTARSNAAAVLPATGVPVNPRGAASPAAVPSEGGKGGGPESAPVKQAGDVPGPSPAPVVLADAQRVAMWCADAGIGDDRRAAFLWAFSDGEYQHSAEVPGDMLGELRTTLDAVRAGELVLVTDPNGESAPQLLLPDDVPFGATTSGPPPAEIVWRELLGQTPGIGQAKLLRRARDLCKDRGLVTEQGFPLATSIDSIPTDLNTELRAWLEEQSAKSA